MRIRGGPCAIQDIKASCPLFLRHAASAGGFAESTWNSLLYHGLEPCGPGRWLQHPGPMMDPQVSYAFFFDLLIAKTLPYFLTGTLASLLFGRLGSKRSEEHTSELQSLAYLVCRLLLEKKKKDHAVIPYTK